MGICCVTQETQTGALQQAEGWDGEEGGREVWEGGDMGVPMADILSMCDSKPQNSVKQLSSIKNNFLKMFSL